MEPEIDRSGSWKWGLLAPFRTRVNGVLFLRRRQIVQTPLFTILFTRILQPDNYRAPHTHTRDFISVILSGGYTEDVFSDPECLSVRRTRVHKRFSVHVMRTAEAHSITEIREPLRTLLFGGRMKAERVFWTPEGPVSWEVYGKEGTGSGIQDRIHRLLAGQERCAGSPRRLRGDNQGKS